VPREKEDKMDFEKWWNEIGSGIIPRPYDDWESHTKRVCEMLFNEIMQKEK